MHIDLDTHPSDADLESLQARLPDYIVTVIREEGEIVAGAYAYFDNNWLYVDNLSVTERLRGRGYGTLIMNALESHAAQHKATGVYLFTADFQARPFYERLGYQVFGEEHGRPPHHIIYYLSKRSGVEKTIDPRIEFVSQPSPALIHHLDEQLIQHSLAYVPFEGESMAVYLRDEEGIIRGGLFGELFWGWFDLWWALDESQDEWANELLETLEAECRRRSALGLVTHTHTHLALLQGRGYIPFATLVDCPPNGASSFLQKRF
jgi:N-acetylglutamate synthase-like GNAT family acetyltransferase